MDATTRSPVWARLTARPLLAALLVYFVVVSIPYGIKCLKDEKSALVRWRSQLLAMVEDGENISDRHNYPNPPIMALILLPIVKLPLPVAALGWYWLKVGMTLLSLFWVCRLVESPEQPFPLWAKTVTVLLSLRAITGDLLHGNVNLFILFLVIGFLYAFQRGRDFLAGIVLALAIACKVTPALFLPYLVWKRAWRALFGCTVGLALFFWPGVVPSLLLGWEQNQQQLTSWYDNMVKPFLIDGAVTAEHQNQSLPGLVYRLLTYSPSFVKYPNNVWTPDQYHNVAALPPEVARWLVKLCMGVFVLFVAWTCRTPRDGQHKPALAAEYAIVVVGMLLFSERTWKHHCVTLLLPFAVLVYHLAVWWDWSGRRLTVLGVLSGAVLLMWLTSISLLGREAGKLAQVYGAYVGAFVVLLAGLGALLRLHLAERESRCPACTHCPEKLRKAG